MPVVGSRSRTRSVPDLTPAHGGVCGEFFHKYGATWLSTGNAMGFAPNPYKTAEVCMDEVHPGPPWKSGGPFRKIRIDYADPQGIIGQGTFDTGTGSGSDRYVGGFCLPIFGTSSQAEVSDLQKSLNTNYLVPSTTGLGDKAYAKLRPKLEKASVFVAIAEAKDIPRMLKTTAHGFHDIWKTMGGNTSGAVMHSKKIADHFLNHQFGWIPFLSDMRQIHDVYTNSVEYSRRITRENNQWIKRTATLVNQQVNTKIGSGDGMKCWPPLGTNYWYMSGTVPKWELWEEKSTIITASGRFLYYRPEFDDSVPEFNSAWNSIQRQMTMYGLRVSPSNIYRATPWTWLADWFTSAGTQIDRITDMAVDSVVSKYMYLMHHQVRKLTLIQTIPFNFAGTKTLSWRRVIEVKQRQSADSPFDFGLSWDSLSPRQLAILAALGISRK